MVKLTPWHFILPGLSLAFLGLALTLGSAPVLAQGDAGVEYAGASSCRGCHRDLSRAHSTSRHALALQVVDAEKGAFVADFSTGEKERTVTFPGESSPRPFTREDIAFIIGSGRYMERYVYRIERGKYAVFPAEWNTAAKKWQPYQGEKSWPDDAAFNFVENCAGCHVTGLDVQRGRWEDEGVQCEACHGPALSHAEIAVDAGREPPPEKIKEIRSAVTLSPDAQICGQCHSAGTDPETKRPFSVRFRPGSALTDVLTLAAPDSTDHWWSSGHAKKTNMQFNEWLKSSHSQSLDTLRSSKEAAPACLECHSADFAFTNRRIEAVKAGTRKGDSPTLPTVETAKFSVTCISCHNPHPDPANKVDFNLRADSYTLCTSCHRATDVTAGIHHPVREMFEGQPLIKDIPGIPATHFSEKDGPRCLTCHMTRIPAGDITNANHTLLPVMPGKTEKDFPDSCAGCHTTLTATDLQSLIDQTQDAVRGRLTVALSRLGTVPKPEPGTDAAALYERVMAALTFVQNDGSLGFHNYAYTDALLSASEDTLAKLSVPGAAVKPPEGPAPTATPAGSLEPITASSVAVRTGFRPATVLGIGLVLLILLIGAIVFFRKSGRREA